MFVSEKGNNFKRLHAYLLDLYFVSSDLDTVFILAAVICNASLLSYNNNPSYTSTLVASTFVLFFHLCNTLILVTFQKYYNIFKFKMFIIGISHKKSYPKRII